MSTTTDKLALFKYDPSTDGAQTFNIKKALNDNWDKLDDAVKEILITLANKAPTVHADRHAKGGADLITPESIGAAPGGFGLGKENMEAIDDCNNAVFSGWYATDSPTTNTPGGNGESGVLCVSRRFDSRIYQEFHGINGGQYSRLFASRVTYGDNSTDLQWGPWEWVNPLMDLNTEYRTTERYMGKPVYCKMVDCGTVPAVGSSKTIMVAPDAEIFSVSAYSPMRGLGIPFRDANGVKLEINQSGNTLVFRNYSETRSDTNALAVVKYTKTTA